MLQVTPTIAIDEAELLEKFARASGPGGQHVNKTSTAVELRFDVEASPSLMPDVKERLKRLAGSRLTGEGVIVLFAQGHRSQELNRQEARERLFDLIRKAAFRPKARRATKPTYASKLKRLEGKTIRSAAKARRARPRADD